MSLWHEDCFRLIVFKKQKTWEVYFKKRHNSSLNCLKEFRSGPWSRKSTITRDFYKEYRLGVVWKLSRALRPNICIANICLPNICFHLLVNFLSSFFETPNSYSLLLLSDGMLTLKLPNLSIHLIFLMGPSFLHS